MVRSVFKFNNNFLIKNIRQSFAEYQSLLADIDGDIIGSDNG